MKIIGIGGLSRSGKDTIAELLLAEGYFGLSFGDVVREAARVRHKDAEDPISVANMTETANWLRQINGPDVILQKALRQFEAEQAAGKNYRGLVLWSIRAPIEVDFILDHGGELIWVDADADARYDRGLRALRPGEHPKITREEFKRQEALQWTPQPGVDPKVQMNASYVKAHATIVLENNGNDLDKFLTQAKQLVSQLG